MIYSFADCRLDLDRRELWRHGALTPVEPQVFDLLAYLIRNRTRVVSRDEVFKALWHERVVSDSVLGSRLHAARAAIGDNGADQRLIRTLRGRGLRFIGTATEESPSGATVQRAAPERSRLAGVLAERPTIVVLPIADFSLDPRHGMQADAVTETIIDMLSRSGWLSVTSRSTAFAYKGVQKPAREIARELSVRYIVEGGLRRVADRIRVAVRLIDALADHQLWAGHYEPGDLSSVQDEIVDKVLQAIEPQLYFAEEMRARQTPVGNLDAWECIVRALSLMNSRARPHVIGAQNLLQKATSLDSGSAQARGLLSMAITMRVHMGWIDRQRAVPRALAAAREALALNPDEPWAHAALGYAMIWQDPDLAVAPCERAVSLNPNFAIGHYFHALASTYAGQWQDAYPHAEAAQRLARRDLLARGYAGAHDNVRATASFAGARYVDGIKFASGAIRDNPKSPTGYRALTINLALGGYVADARAALRTLKALAPDMSQQWIKQNAVWASSEQRRRYVEAFSSLGLR